MLRKISQLNLICWCGNSLEMYSFYNVSDNSLKILQKLCIPTDFPYQEISKTTVFSVVTIFLRLRQRTLSPKVFHNIIFLYLIYLC